MVSQSLLIFLVFFITACNSNTAGVPDVIDEDFDARDFVKGDLHYKQMVWDPTSTTDAVFNVSGSSPLHVVLIRKKIGHCEMFFLRLKGFLEAEDSMVACIAELSSNSLKQRCTWVNKSEPVKMNQGSIYGMPDDCGPWYLTVYIPKRSNTTQLSVEVSGPYDPLVFRWFRVLTNLAFIPAIILSLKRSLYAEAIVYFLNFTLSWTYHLCEAEFHCFKRYSRLHISDYYTSDLSIAVTIWCMTRIQPPNKHLLYLALAIFLQFAVTETYDSDYQFFVILILTAPALVFILYQCIYRTVKYKRIYPSARRWLLNLLPGFALATGAAVISFTISEHDNYYYMHCIWHITIMLSVPFLLPVPADKDADERWWMEKMEKENYTPLL